ncbi:MAG: putative ATP-dependent RNA helicase DHR1 [Watsoniomyces obsoletus]|nr:MAG: putative ATP-dependent RNA helicase DHR1 [Watsoniomyces obsoletus]
MASPRLLFLYPSFFRSWRSLNGPHSQATIEHIQPQAQRYSRFHTSVKRQLEPFIERHGTAVEPPPGLGNRKPPSSGGSSKQQKEDKPLPSEVKSHVNGLKNETSSEQTKADSIVKTAQSAPTRPNMEPNLDKPPQEPPAVAKKPDTVLHMDPPSDSEKGSHLHAPPYVHHFDMYTLVRSLQEQGFTEDQSITLMKAVRGLLANNLELAREELVSKSDSENRTYLFRAACSELQTEIQRNRKTEMEKMRSERVNLQHEVDILSQKLGAELATLKDEVKGMFNDRKMAVRMEQRAMESSVSELHNKITVKLNSEIKSEVEGLRWVLTRRAAIAIATMALLILGSLRYGSYRIHMQEIANRDAATANSTTRSPSSAATSNNPNEENQGGTTGDSSSEVGG